jgi:hypothetical protein
MDFTPEEILLFIREQREELLLHCHFLWDVYRSHCTEQEAAVDWVRRYAHEYREVGSLLLALMGEIPHKKEIFHEGMREIMRHKFLESEKVNHDVGLKAAGGDWLAHHACQWLSEARQKYLK